MSRLASPGPRRISRGRKGRRSLLAALLMAAVGSAAHAFDWSDDAAGPTCEHHLTMGGLAWAHRGGDWLDANGVSQGTSPYATRDVPEGAGLQRVEIDVTTALLSRRQVSRSLTLMLRAEPGPLHGQADFLSRETGDPGMRPALELSYGDGRREFVSAEADTFLDCTSLFSLGRQDHLSVRRDRSSLIRFTIPKSPTTPPSTARLLLRSHRQFAGGARVGVYIANMPTERPLGAARLGVASRYLLDAGIVRDPAVLFVAGFDEWPWMVRWRDLTVRSTAEPVSTDPERGFEPLDGRALRVQMHKAKHLGLDLRYYFSRHFVPEPDDIYLRYYLRLGSDWNPSVDGGKLPGLAGTYGRAGWGDRMANGRNGWSMRAGFAARPAAAGSVRGITALATVACHARIKEPTCETWGWGQAASALLQNNRWYSIEQHVRLNTPGQADGIFEAWVDGHLALRRTDVVYRDVPDLRIETAWFDVYHGGREAAPHDMTLYLDNVVVAREYIGPMAGVMPLPQPTRQ